MKAGDSSMTRNDRIGRKQNAEDAERKSTEDAEHKTEVGDAGFGALNENSALADYRLPNPFFFGIGG
jgi:hypothetical protein